MSTQRTIRPPRYTLVPGGARSAAGSAEEGGVRRTQLHSRSSRALAAKPSRLPAEAAAAGTAAATDGESSASVAPWPTASPPRAGSGAGSVACGVVRQLAAIATEAPCSALSSAMLVSMAAAAASVSSGASVSSARRKLRTRRSALRAWNTWGCRLDARGCRLGAWGRSL